ncbi:FtsW/RodA/SpoVE family cell cycle protein [Jeotgalibacillus sp. R-1-5s-1]|uniref:FtsW/RodA/SpoVE family cell cycle protein n=1 Tax=Jeotgalibacillus sp. R-1-5s-1 TaxID=2555897 RepID=UPI001068F4A4|nr:FtsW/RodA/SpoVE family cell cycle protein [Jeotgalibacillus sp. R-1-5s-1]TFD94366.1 FtsW/RodA/SpoVE family cell cycle protein [Jeotgalibacillus sp. R-1-5s-1]
MKNKGEHFLKEVTHHIKSREAREFVTAELAYHLKSAKNMWVQKGMSEEAAEGKAVDEMGSPVKLGQELNRVHKPKVDWVLIGLLVVAMGIGFLPILTLTYNVDGFLFNKFVIVLLGVGVAVGMMFVDYRKLEKFGLVFYSAGVLILLMLRYSPTDMVNGQPFIVLGPLAIESLMALPLFFLAWSSFLNNKKLKWWHVSVLYLLTLYLFFSLPGLSAVFIYIAMMFVMLWCSQLGKKSVLAITAIPLSLLVTGGAFFWFAASEYQRGRLSGFLNPKANSEGSGYIYLRLEELLSSAKWFGSAGEQVFIPAAHTDLVFVSMTYHFGYVFAFFIVLVLALFAARMLTISRGIQHSFGTLLLAGGMALFIVPFIYNIAMILAMLPITSISLPFISYGVMPTVLNAFVMGIVLSVYRRKSLVGAGQRTV